MAKRRSDNPSKQQYNPVILPRKGHKAKKQKKTRLIQGVMPGNARKWQAPGR